MENKWTKDGQKPNPEDYVEVFADLDELGQVPTDKDHLLTQGAHPELKYELDNVRGRSRTTHCLRHQKGRDAI